VKVHPVAELFPMMSDDELQELANDIKENGLQHPIVVKDGVLLDGRNRFAACKMVGIGAEQEDYKGDSPVAFIVASNLKRRHLNPSQKATIGVEIEPALADELESIRRAKISASRSGETMANLPPSQKARDQAAKVVGVSGRMVQDAKALKRDAPELFEEVKKGKVTVHEAKKKIKANETAKARKVISDAGKQVKQSEKFNVYHGDIATWQSQRKYDFIVTDPPYPKEFLPLWSILAKRSNEWLKDGGLLIAMSGQSYLDEIYEMMCKHLKYYWTAAYLTPGQPTPLRQVNVNTTWKPLLIFVKGKYTGKIFGDVFKSPGNEKSHHEWGQSEGGMFDIISRICLPGQYILDPFCGAGTTGVAALRHGCLFDGVDIEIENVNISKGRMK
jgi:16S rRNA G966 N2-methylase RsmD